MLVDGRPTTQEPGTISPARLIGAQDTRPAGAGRSAKFKGPRARRPPRLRPRGNVAQVTAQVVEPAHASFVNGPGKWRSAMTRRRRQRTGERDLERVSNIIRRAGPRAGPVPALRLTQPPESGHPPPKGGCGTASRYTLGVDGGGGKGPPPNQLLGRTLTPDQVSRAEEGTTNADPSGDSRAAARTPKTDSSTTDNDDGNVDVHQLELQFFTLLDGYNRNPPERVYWRDVVNIVLKKGLATAAVFIVGMRRVTPAIVHHVALTLYYYANAGGVIQTSHAQTRSRLPHGPLHGNPCDHGHEATEPAPGVPYEPTSGRNPRDEHRRAHLERSTTAGPRAPPDGTSTEPRA